MKTIILLCAVLAGSAPLFGAYPLTESTVTEIIKNVNLLRVGGSSPTTAQLNDLVKAPDRVRTGPESRAELTAPDKTITRVGANTVFSFESGGRVLNLESGSLLFHSPKGAGGGTIKSGGASAAVLGTTLVVSVTTDGGFKVIVLEGRGQVTLPNGKKVSLHAGQMVYVLPSGVGVSDVLDINLGKLVAGSLLVNGFAHELPSLPLVRAAVDAQGEQLAKGRAEDTGLAADHFARRTTVNDGLNAIDNNTYATFRLPFLKRPDGTGGQTPPGRPPLPAPPVH